MEICVKFTKYDPVPDHPILCTRLENTDSELVRNIDKAITAYLISLSRVLSVYFAANRTHYLASVFTTHGLICSFIYLFVSLLALLLLLTFPLIFLPDALQAYTSNSAVLFLFFVRDTLLLLFIV